MPIKNKARERQASRLAHWNVGWRLFEGVLVIMMKWELNISCQTNDLTFVYSEYLERQKRAEDKWNSLHVFTSISCFHQNKLTACQIRSNKLVMWLRVTLL